MVRDNVVPLRPPPRPAPGFDPRQRLGDLLWRLRGRIGRATYAWTFGAAAALWWGGFELMRYAPIGSLWGAWLAGWVLTAPAAWVAVAVTVKRAQDCGLSGGLAVLLAVPGVRWALAVGLLLAPSEPGWNRHGWAR